MHVVPLEAFDQTIAQPCQVGKHFDKGETFNAGLTNHRHKIWIECRFAANELDLPAPELRRLVEDARPIASTHC